MADMGWYPDPSGRNEQRYFDGERWTEHVANAGATGVDPIDAPGPALAATDAGPAGGSGRKPWLWVVGALVAVAVVAGLVVLLTGGDDDGGDDQTDAVATTRASGGDGTTRAPATTAATATTKAPTTTAAPEAGTQENPAPLGSEQKVGDWKVTVTGFTADATAAVAAANQFNEPPTNGTYSLVRVRATYDGDGSGSAGFAFTVGYLGSDAVFYEGCSGAIEPEPMYEQPDVARGGTVEGNFCIDIPTAVLGTGAVYVEDFFSFDDSRTFWKTS
jgi:hypothetical protein